MPKDDNATAVDVKRQSREPEWLEFGDPRCAKGHYRPKNNLDKWLKTADGWSQKRLAKEMGTDEGTVSKWINGKLYLTDRKLVKIARITGLSLPYLLDMCHQGNPADDEIELDALDYSELEDEQDEYLEKHGYSRFVDSDIPEWQWGVPYGPHEVDNFAMELASEQETLWSERWRSERRGLPSRNDDQDAFIEALNTEWDPKEHYTVYTYLHFLGDIRDPWHLADELHKDLMSLRPGKRAHVLDALAGVMLGCAGAKTVNEMMAESNDFE